MVEVRVGDEREVEAGGIEGGKGAVLRAGLAPSLVHAAIDREAHAPGIDQEAGAGHFARRAQEADLHAAILTGRGRAGRLAAASPLTHVNTAYPPP